MTLNIYIFLKKKITNYTVLSQEIFDNSINFLLKYPITRFLILKWIKLLFYYHFFWESICKYIGLANMNVIALLLSFFCSRLHVAGYMIMLSLIIFRLEFSFRRVAKYYQKDMTRLSLHFPEWQNDKRHMRKASQAVIEALEDPKVQAVTVGVLGALSWKAMDLWDTVKSAEIAAQDRLSAELTADKDRETENIKHRENLAAENIKHRESLAAEADQRQQDRETENVRHRENLAAENVRHRESLAAEADQRQLDRESAERIATVANKQEEKTELTRLN